MKKKLLCQQHFYYTFTTNLKWLVVIVDSNYITNNNLPIMICYENIVKIL